METYQHLEAALEEWSGLRNVVACNSGTAALHLALEAMQFPSGSKVLIPDLCMIAVPRAVAMAGHVPVPVPCGDDLLIDPKRTEWGRYDAKAVILVHTYGRMCDRQQFYGRGVKVIEDCAEAHGAPFDGYVPDAACWSFYKNKIVHGEEGGAVAFKDAAHAKLARSLRCHGFTDAHDFTHIPRGCNYRLANSLAELILDSLRRIEWTLASRRRQEEWCEHYCPVEWRMPPRAVPWVYDFRVPGLANQDEVVRKINEKGIAARHCFKPTSTQPEFGGLTEVADWRRATETIYLPLDILSEAAFDILATCIRKAGS